VLAPLFRYSRRDIGPSGVDLKDQIPGGWWLADWVRVGCFRESCNWLVNMGVSLFRRVGVHPIITDVRRTNVVRSSVKSNGVGSMKNAVYSVLLVAAGLMVGCANPPSHKQFASFLKAHEHRVSGTETRVNAGDGVVITSRRIQEVDGERQVVRPDGKLSLRLVGDVRVAGLTHREMETKIEQLYRPYYTKPDIDVRLESRTQQYYVLGQVSSSGGYRFTGRDTLMDALIRARPNNIAWSSRVKVLRPSPIAGERREIEVDVKKMLRTGDTRMNVLLEPNDIVWVPPTPMGWVALRIQEVLYPARPLINIATAPATFRDIPDFYDGTTNTNVQGFR
jgi:polysaccharide biosynthesis/export protein